MHAKIGQPVFPGEILSGLQSAKGEKTFIGPGLKVNGEEPNSLVATKAGTLAFRPPNIYWVETVHKRYVPKKNDLVVGVIVKRAGDSFKVDIGSSELASLSMMAFEGATKKQKPDLQTGDAVYARLLSAHREMEPELICVDSFYKAGKLGKLPEGGFIIHKNPNVAHDLLKPENSLLRTLGRKFPYEVAIGMNGTIWIKARKTTDVLNVIKAIECCEKMTENEVLELCNKY